MPASSIKTVPPPATSQWRAFWLKGFGFYGQQETEGFFSSYKTTVGGLAGGADFEILPEFRLGAAVSYANTNVDLGNFHASDDTEVNSYQVLLYAMKEWGPFYVDGMTSYTHHDFNQHRTAPLGRTTNDNWDGDQWTVRADAGYRIPVGPAAIVPMVGAQWSQLEQDGYTGTGAGALNLQVQEATTLSVKSILGAVAYIDQNWWGVAMRPEAKFNWMHEFGDRNTDTVASFSGGGATFVTPGQALARNSYTLGLGLTANPAAAAKISLNYDWVHRDGFDGHAFQLAGRWDF